MSNFAVAVIATTIFFAVIIIGGQYMQDKSRHGGGKK